MEKSKEIERSIIKKYRKEIWSRFVKAVADYKLINENDKVTVCISGGKDSFLLAKCIQELQRHGKFKFEARYVVMNPGYNEFNLNYVIDNAKTLDIPVEIFESDIFDVVKKISPNEPCYLCARMRRGYLYSKAKELGCNKIALGHHFNDVIETVLMGMLYGAQMQTMMPKLHSTSHKGMELIRPLYFVKEDDIIKWGKNNGLDFLKCACKITEISGATDKNGSKRQEIKKLIASLKEIYDNVDINIMRSTYNVNLDTIISYYKGDEIHSFLDDY